MPLRYGNLSKCNSGLRLPYACPSDEVALLIGRMQSCFRSIYLRLRLFGRSEQVRISFNMRSVVNFSPGRPRARPNYSFIRQLQVFFECNYDITPTAPPYITWKEQHNFDKTNSLRVIDGMPILPGQLFLSLCVSPHDQSLSARVNLIPC